MAVVLINDYLELVKKDEEGRKNVLSAISRGIQETERLSRGSTMHATQVTVEHIGKFSVGAGVSIAPVIVQARGVGGGVSIGHRRQVLAFLGPNPADIDPQTDEPRFGFRFLTASSQTINQVHISYGSPDGLMHVDLTYGTKDSEICLEMSFSVAGSTKAEDIVEVVRDALVAENGALRHGEGDQGRYRAMQVMRTTYLI